MVGKKQESTTVAVTTSGRRGRNVSVMAVTATLMLLIGLVNPVAAAVPDAPTGGAIPTPAGLTATVAWTPAAGGDPATSFEVSISPAVEGFPDDFGASPASIPGLTPGTAYTVDVVAKNDDGSSAPLTRTFTTHSNPGAPTIGTAARVGTTTSATVAWTPPASDGGSPISDYEVRVDGAGAWTSVGTTSPGQVNGLSVGSHTFEVRAVNGVGRSGPSADSNSVTITAPATAPGSPTNVSAAQVGTTNSATVSWSAPASDGGSPITGYQVQVDAGNWNDAGSGPSTTVNGLALGSRSIRLRAVNAVGPGTPSVAASVTINAPPPAVPGPPGTVTVSNSGSTINVAWTAAPGVVEDYLVQLRQGNTVVQSKPAGGLGTSFGGVSPGSYTLRVVARNVSGEGPERTANYTLTLAASAPRNVDATVNTSNTVVITWLAPLDDGGGVGEYRISLSPAADGPRIVSGGTTTTSFSGLPSGNYTVSVVALNGAGAGAAGTDTFSIVVPPGSPLNVKTTAPSTTNGTATVTWDPPANNGNGTISEYVVTLGGKTVTVAASAPRTASFTGLPIGKLTATVQARNAQGLSAAGSSPEFFSKRPVHPFATREAFARQAFIDLFGVAATPGEFTEIAAATAVDGSNAPAVIANLMQNERFENRRQVSRLYFAYFQRVPDASGQKYWTDLMDRGVLDLQDVSDEFARSPEFINTYGGLNEAEFLVVVYNNVLLRTPDIVGFNYWLGERNRGLTRGGVMTWFTEGNEYIALSLPAIDTSLAHIYLLGRSPSTGEYALWVTRIRDTNDSVETLIASIWVSDEYAARITPS